MQPIEALTGQAVKWSGHPEYGVGEIIALGFDTATVKFIKDKENPVEIPYSELFLA